MRGTAAAILLLSAEAVGGQGEARRPVLTTPHFALYSDVETNLNDALIAAGLARKNKKPELFREGEEAGCFEKLPPSSRAGWDGAVDYYARILSPGSFGSKPQFLVRFQLAGLGVEGRSAADEEYLDVTRGFRTAAAPAYRACRFPSQDARNRKWIAEIGPRLAAEEEKLAARLEALYRKKWKTLPILVDVVETVDWSGANTAWSDAGQGDILITSTVTGPAAFETLFHEASHVLMDRGDPVRAALEKAAKASGVKLPGDLWHVVLFYTTGEAVRQVLDERGPAGYTPMLYEIFARPAWVNYREPLEKEWKPYVDGKRTLDEAASGLIEALRR